MVHPMTSLTGYVAYLDYTVGTTKGATTQDDFYNGPFKLGDINSDYTSQKISEAATLTRDTLYAPVWATSGVQVKKDVFRTVTISGTVTRVISDYWFNEQSAEVKATEAFYDVMLKKTDNGSEHFVDFDSDGKINAPTGWTAVPCTVFYEYNNEVIPQAENKLPTLKGIMKNMTLLAHARRIAIYYSQIAAFQA